MVVVQERFHGGPARRERHDQIVPGTACRRQYLAPAGEPDDLDLQPGLFVDLAVQRRVQGFAELDPAARQRIEAFGRRAGAAHQQDLVITEDRAADGELGYRGWTEGNKGSRGVAWLVSMSAS